MSSITEEIMSIAISGTSVVPTKWGVSVTVVNGAPRTLYYNTRAEARIARNFFSGMTSNVESVKLV